MKAFIETFLAVLHLIFGVLVFISNTSFGSVVCGVLSVLFLVAALKIADYDIYIVRENNGNHTTAKV